MKTIAIIEDEVDIRNDLLTLVKRNKRFALAGSAGTVAEAIDLIMEKRPDIVLMDIQLGNHTAFDLLKEVATVPFSLIFVTAYSHHAIRAIKFGALDYLLKPIDEQELAEALAKTDRPHRLAVNEAALRLVRNYWQSIDKAPREIALRTQQELLLVQVEDIIYCKSNGSYTTFYIKDRRPLMVSKAIKVYEELLPENAFLRPHQSYLVNYAFIKGYHRDGYLVLSDGQQLPVSVRKREQVIRYFSR